MGRTHETPPAAAEFDFGLNEVVDGIEDALDVSEEAVRYSS